MLNDTTQDGPVGKPTLMKIAKDASQSKAADSPLYFDLRCDVGDDFDDMAKLGLQPATANRLRRIAQGLTGIREIARVLSIFETERLLRDSFDANAHLSPRAQEGILRGAEVLADLLNQEIYALGTELTHRAEGVPQ